VHPTCHRRYLLRFTSNTVADKRRQSAERWNEEGSLVGSYVQIPKQGEDCDHDANLAVATGEPEGVLWRAEDHDYSPDSTESARINATLLVLVRNEELNDLVKTMEDLERTWNNKFNYPWTFMNDKPFSEEFKRKTQAITKAKCHYGMSTMRSGWVCKDGSNKK
jgi:hypothetical protein